MPYEFKVKTLVMTSITSKKPWLKYFLPLSTSQKSTQPCRFKFEEFHQCYKILLYALAMLGVFSPSKFDIFQQY